MTFTQFVQSLKRNSGSEIPTISEKVDSSIQPTPEEPINEKIPPSDEDVEKLAAVQTLPSKSALSRRWTKRFSAKPEPKTSNLQDLFTPTTDSTSNRKPDKQDLVKILYVVEKQ